MVLLAATAFILTACSGLQEDGGEKNIRINLPPIVSASGNSRALSGDRLPTLKTETRRYRVTVNGITREGTGSSYEFTLAVGIRATAIIECLNSSGDVIIRAVKDFTVSGGDNIVDINLKADGDEIIPQPPAPPPSVKSAVSYELDGGDWSSTSAPPQTEEYDEGATVTITTNVPTKQGFTFLGWKSSVSSLIPSGGGDNFQSGSTFAMPSSAVTFTAQWTNKPVHDVTYDLGFQPSGGSQTSTVQVAEDASVSLAAPSAERKGYTFKQWLYNGTAAPSDLKMSTSNITLTAEWNVIPYTITYDANGGGTNPGNTTFTVADSSVTFASSATLQKQGYSFANWETTGGTSVSNMNATQLIAQISSGTTLALRAKWEEMTELNVSASGDDTTGDGSSAKPFATLQKAFTVASSLTTSTPRTILVQDNLADTAATMTGGTITLNLNGHTLNGNGNDRVISINGGSLTLNDIGSGKITGGGGGLYVGSGATFVMEAGTITGNTKAPTWISNNDAIHQGGGVSVDSGTFIMNGGTISNNTCTPTIPGQTGNSVYGGQGGGVYIKGTFTMNGGTISGNKTSLSGYSGVVLGDGTFTLNNGTITGNNSGGVQIDAGTFVMENGTISNNTNGGVSVSDAAFTMKGGSITGNSSGSAGGGGINVIRATFTKTGGSVSGNTAPSGQGSQLAVRESSTYDLGDGTGQHTVATSSDVFYLDDDF